jgi:ribosomal protein S18
MRRFARLAVNGSQHLRSMKMRTFCTKSTSGKGKAPDNFYDEEVESEKEFLDITTSLLRDGNLTELTRVKEPITWEEIEEKQKTPLDLQTIINESVVEYQNASNEEVDRLHDESDHFYESKTAAFISDMISHTDLGDHIEKFGDSYVPEEYINYTMPWKENDGIDDPLLDKFVPNTSPERFTYGSQGERACPGKLQRRGKAGVLKCHILDLDELHHLDVVNLRRFLSDDAEILGKPLSGLCSKCQRKVAKCVKTARQLGVLPHIGQYFIEDSRPSHVDQGFHDAVKGAYGLVESKTVF